MKRLLDALRSTIGRRLQRVMSAQFFNQVTTILVQLGLVPVLLYAWGKETYGIWLLLSAVPAYLTFSDFGFTLIAKNEMLIQVSGGRHENALVTFQSVFKVLNAIMPLLLGLSFLALMIVDLNAVLNLGSFTNSDARLVMMLLLLNVIAYQYFLLICGGVRCENRLAMEATWGAAARLAEGAAVAIVALLGGGLIIAALAVLATKLAFCLALYIWLRRASPWLSLGHAHATKSEIKRLLKPALAFMLMPISQSLLIQAPLMIIGALINPVAVVIFATTRTLTRVGTAATNMLNGTLQGEYSMAFGQSDGALLRKVMRYHQLASMVMILVYGALLYALRGPLMTFYTHGEVAARDPFFLLMILTIAAEMKWSSISTPLSSINRHVSFANWSLAVAAIGTPVCYFATSAYGLEGAALSMLAIHLAILGVGYLLRHHIDLPEEQAASAGAPSLMAGLKGQAEGGRAR